MRIIAIILGIVLTSILGTGFYPHPGKEQDPKSNTVSGQVNVYYFHYERRCATCINVENTAQNAIKKHYPEQYKKGEITFQSVNLEEKAGEDLAKKLKVSGQTLLIVKGDRRADITSTAFMYANTNPEKIEATVKSEIDKLRAKK